MAPPDSILVHSNMQEEVQDSERLIPLEVESRGTLAETALVAG